MLDRLKFKNGTKMTVESILSTEPAYFASRHREFTDLCIFLSLQDPTKCSDKFLKHCLKIYWSHALYPGMKQRTDADTSIISSELASRSNKRFFLSSMILSVVAITIAVMSLTSSLDSSELSKSSLSILKEDILRESKVEREALMEIKELRKSQIESNKVNKQLLESTRKLKSLNEQSLKKK